MRGKKQSIVFLAVIAVLVGGGYWLHTMQMGSLRKKLTDRCQKAESELNKLRETLEEGRAAAAAAAAAKEKARSEAKKAEAERAKSENERKMAESNAAAKKLEKENLENKRKLAQEETVRAEKAAVEAAARQKQQEAEKIASEAKAKELAQERALREAAQKIAAEQRVKAEADAARALAEQKKAEAEKEKSANDIKAAELRAAALRDEKLLMYKRGGVSEAERREIQRAEKMLKLWESGMLTPENLAAATMLPSLEELSQPAPAQDEDPAIAEEQKKQKEMEAPPPPPDPRDEKIKELGMARHKRLDDEKRRVSEDVVARIEPLLRAAEKSGRTRDAEYYRSVLRSLIPDYAEPKGTESKDGAPKDADSDKKEPEK